MEALRRLCSVYLIQIWSCEKVFFVKINSAVGWKLQLFNSAVNWLKKDNCNNNDSDGDGDGDDDDDDDDDDDGDDDDDNDDDNYVYIVPFPKDMKCWT